MDVDTAPLLVKRRGLKRRNRQPQDESNDMPHRHKGGPGSRKASAAQLQLHSVPEDVEPSSTQHRVLKRPTTLEQLDDDQQQQMLDEPSPVRSAAFTEYRDTVKPPYLKYSRDDFSASGSTS
jgi:hypothetical protein